jgi:hypothetical protein
MMKRQNAISPRWAGLLRGRFKAALKGSSIPSGAQSDAVIARSATAPMPFGMSANRGLRASSRIRLVQSFGVSSDGIDRAPV